MAAIDRQLSIYRQFNTPLVPIQPDSKAYDKWAWEKRGYQSLADLKARGIKVPDILAWWGEGRRNTAIVTNGHLLVVDFDNEDRYWQFVAKMPFFSSTLTVKSPHGYHCYYYTKKPIARGIISTWADVELKHSGDCILCPPSRIGLRQYRFEGILPKPMTVYRAESLPFVKLRMTEGALNKEKRAEGGAGTFPFIECDRRDPIGRIKHNLSIAAYLRRLGYDLIISSPNGSYYLAYCPFHEDNVPSFWINEEMGLCNCFRQDCKAEKAMDILNLYQRLNKCDLSQAIKELCDLIGI